MPKKERSESWLSYISQLLIHRTSGFLLISLSFLFIICTACGSTPDTSGTSNHATPTSAFHTTIQTTDKAFTVQLSVTPNQLGTNTFTVTLLSQGQVPSQQLQVTLETTMLDMAMGTDSITLNADGKGSFSGQGTLTMSGRWQIRVVIHTPDHVLHEGQVQATLA